MIRHTPLQQFKQAKQIAHDYGLHIAESGGKYQLYRKTPGKLVYIGQRGTAESLRRLVCKAANFH